MRRSRRALGPTAFRAGMGVPSAWASRSTVDQVGARSPLMRREMVEWFTPERAASIRCDKPRRLISMRSQSRISSLSGVATPSRYGRGVSTAMGSKSWYHPVRVAAPDLLAPARVSPRAVPGSA